jgi:hypothetical protein
VISTEAVEELGLEIGVVVVASVKATDVTLETPRSDGAGAPADDSLADEVDLPTGDSSDGDEPESTLDL